MDKNTMIISVAAGILGVLSVLLGFAAETTRIQLSDIYLSDYGCEHPDSPAFGLAVVAALLLVIAQIILTAFMGFCCKTGKNLLAAPNILVSQTESKRTSAIIMLSSSWVAFAVSFILFILGALANTPGGQVDDKCMTVKPGIFATASMLSLLTVGLGIGAFYLLSNTFGVSGANPGIAMGTPQQFPQQAGNGQMQFQQGYGYGQVVQKPGTQTGFTQGTQNGTMPTQNGQGQNFYPPPGTTPTGYGYNTMTNM
ncbi:hypothetical protein LUZ60_014181 [Juncus effusus]|nr:hypothetical protein LUZ60_014181 [Juncus effusus]